MHFPSDGEMQYQDPEHPTCSNIGKDTIGHEKYKCGNKFFQSRICEENKPIVEEFDTKIYYKIVCASPNERLIAVKWLVFVAVDLKTSQLVSD
jgi:hypothetical protein